MDGLWLSSRMLVHGLASTPLGPFSETIARALEDTPGFRKAAMLSLDLVSPSGPGWTVVTPVSWAKSPHPVCLQLL